MRNFLWTFVKQLNLKTQKAFNYKISIKWTYRSQKPVFEKTSFILRQTKDWEKTFVEHISEHRGIRL